MKKEKVFLIILFILAIATRFLFFLYEINVNNITENKKFYVYDAKEYQELALSLSKGNFTEEWSPPFLNIILKTKTLRTPGYPLFLLLVYSLFGMNNNTAVIVIQIFLSSLIVIFTYKLSMVIFNDYTISFLAGLLVVFDFSSITLSNFLLSETLAAFFIITGLLFFIKNLKDDKIYYNISSSFLLAVATYVRPITLYLPLFLLLPIICYYWKDKKKLILNSFIFVVVFLSGIGIWIYRNYKETRVPVFSSIQGINIYYYRAAGVIALEKGEGIIDAFRVGDAFNNAQKELTMDVKSLWLKKKINFEQKTILLEKIGTHIILSHPIYYIELALLGAVRMMLAVPRRSEIELLFNTSNYIVLWLILCLQFIIIFIGYIVGAVIYLKKKNSIFWIAVITIALYFILVSSGPESDGRFRIIWLPFITILSSYGLKQIWYKIKKQNNF